MEQHHSDQTKIWDHFQNEGVHSFSQSHGRLEFLVRRLQRGERVLNVGVGNGTLERLATMKGCDVWCLDPSKRAIDRLRTELQLGERAKVGFSQAMPFPDEHFDVVVMSEVLEHLDPDVFQTTLSEVRRVLRKGGRFIGTVPARERLEDSLVVCPQCGCAFHRWGHKQTFDIASLSTALGGVFVVECAEEHFFVPWAGVGLWKKVQGLVKKFLSWRGIGTYGICRNIYFSARK